MVNSVQGISPAVFQMFDDLSSGVFKKGNDSAKDTVKDIAEDKTALLKNDKSKAESADKKSSRPDFSQYEDKLRSLIGESNLVIEFSIDEESKKMIMKVIDDETKEVVRQYPSDISLKIARILNESMDLGHVANFKA